MGDGDDAVHAGVQGVMELRRSRKDQLKKKRFAVTVVGAAGGIGQPLSLLLKACPLVKDLALYDVAPTQGIAADLSHVSTGAKITGFTGNDMDAALKDRDVVVIPADMPRKPGMTRDELFNINAGIVQKIAESCARSCPDAAFLVISNPVNSLVPVFAEILKAAGVFNPKKLFGVTTLDTVRARTFVAEAKSVDVDDVAVPVVGGHSGKTIIPVLSASGFDFTDDERAALTERIRKAGDEVVAAKAGAGSATLSMAYAAADFATAVMDGLSGTPGVVQCAYISRDAAEALPLPYFAAEVQLGEGGVAGAAVPKLSADEQAEVDAALVELEGNIQKGVEFVTAGPPVTPKTILDFWFALSTKEQFTTDPALDTRVQEKFGTVLEQARAGELAPWRESAKGRLAEVIVLDQFSRNVHRGTAAAFSHDAMALTLAQEAVRLNILDQLSDGEKLFLLLPYMHSESRVVHEVAVKLFRAAGQGLDFELKHKAVIDKFGRYPHRNALLGRVSTPEEVEHLKDNPGW